MTELGPFMIGRGGGVGISHHYHIGLVLDTTVDVVVGDVRERG